MSNIIELSAAYDDVLWTKFANDFETVTTRTGNLETVPQAILNVLVGLLGERTADMWIGKEVTYLDNTVGLELLNTEMGIKALKMFLLTMPN